MLKKENTAEAILGLLQSPSLKAFLEEMGLNLLQFLELMNAFDINENEENELLLKWQQAKNTEKIRIIVDLLPINEEFTSEKLAEIFELKTTTIEKQLQLLVTEGVLKKSKNKWTKISTDLLHLDRLAGHEKSPDGSAYIDALYLSGHTGNSTSHSWREHN